VSDMNALVEILIEREREAFDGYAGRYATSRFGSPEAKARWEKARAIDVASDVPTMTCPNSGAEHGVNVFCKCVDQATRDEWAAMQTRPVDDTPAPDPDAD
jgi:hypothetical protein